MESKTPIQEALDFIEACIKKNKDRNDFEAGEVRAYENTKTVLESLLPKEKEFVEKVYQKGVDWCNWTDAGSLDPYYVPDKEEFLNQLYPEK